MKFERAIFRSLVARRITLLFGLCAIVPILVLGLFSYLHVNTQLLDQSRQRLLHSTKSLGMSVYERLISLQAEMNMVVSVWRTDGSAATLGDISEEYRSQLDQHYLGIQVLYQDGETAGVFGQNFRLPELSLAEEQHGFAGEDLVLTRSSSSTLSRIFLALPFSAENGRKALLISEIQGLYLWYAGTESTLPGQTELHVLDHEKNLIFTSAMGAYRFPDDTFKQIQPKNSGWFSWNMGDNEYFACYRDLFMESRFFSPTWTMVVSELKSYMNAPAVYFKQIYPPVLIFSLLAVILLSITQIRKNLVPLEKLKAGADEMATKNFETRVEVSSNDEFGQVARSFNDMAVELGRQFKSLSIRAEIDRAILATMEPSEIARTLVQDVRNIHPCKGICVTIVEDDDSESVESYFSLDTAHQGMEQESSILSQIEVERMRATPNAPELASSWDAPRFLKPLVRQGMTAFHLFPIFLSKKLAGIISLGYEGRSSALEEIELLQVRQLVDQVGVALSNARLIKELRVFHWGTLTALARAIDAKSHWTAGHSEKVTRLAVKIGKAMRLKPEELDILRRGGLLHDIGKLGIPNSILDKKGSLTPEEREVIQTHPFLGAQILEPISSFADVVDIVFQHHENYDGSGYPNQISREDISLYGRIVAVADRFDAMTAERPYREAMKQETAVNKIIQQSGHWFDPKIVRAFLEVIDQEENINDTRRIESGFFIDRGSQKNGLRRM